MIINAWIIVVQIMKSVVARMMVFLDISGAVRSLFKNPNSRSNIKGRPAFSDPVKQVKTIMPQLKKGPYPFPVLNKCTGAF